MGPLLATLLPAGLNMLSNLFGAKTQQSNNMELAKYQYRKDREMLEYQNAYNSPMQQMARFKEAGLNPNLMYGQGNAGNMSSAPQFPNVQPGDFQSAFANLGTQIQQMRLMGSQADLTEQKVRESGIKQQLMKSQDALLKANPYMRKEYVDMLVNNLSYATSIKESESILSNFQAKSYRAGSNYSIGQEKIMKELELLDQKFQLNKSDQQIKAQILESKEFQNQLLEIQRNWMKDADITPQHIYQFIQMVLTKMM